MKPTYVDEKERWIVMNIPGVKYYEMMRDPAAWRIAAREFMDLCKLKSYWLSVYLVSAVDALTAAFDADRIASFSERVFIVFALMTVAAAFCAFSAGIIRVVTGQSATERLDAVVKAFALGVLLATVPVRLMFCAITGYPFSLSEVTRALIHGSSLAFFVVLTFWIVHFRFAFVLGQERTDQPVGTDGLIPDYVESDDHYLKIVSSRGVELVRAKLSDVAEKFADHGLRCHKSYWVSHAAIKQRRREGRQLLLVLRDGTEIPVGRSFEKDVRTTLTLGRGQLYANAIGEQESVPI